MKKSLVCIILLLAPLSLFAQKERKVEAEYTYIVPENVSREQARRTALERAQIQAIADEFGTNVSQSVTTFVTNQNGQSNSDFFSLGSSDVKGEWIETIGTPKYDQGFDDNGEMWVRCKVVGRIREIVTAKIDIIAKVLRGGAEEKYEDYEFKSNDDMFLYFQSPVNGYLAVYLVDEASQQAYCLLPYKGSADASQQIRHDKSYYFFSAKHAQPEERDIVDEMTMTCADAFERNDLYVIFSPHQFTKANTHEAEGLLPRQLSYQDFNNWLSRARKRDKDMNVEKKLITITK